MTNPIVIHSMKTISPWGDYSRILFYEIFVMNQREWKEFSRVDKVKAHYWYNKVTKKRISREFESLENCDKDATVIHHLRDTEEKRKYNDEHYELFGFEIDEDGNEIFNYGKYVVFWTKEHHNEYHKCSEETRKKLSIASSGKNNPMYGVHRYGELNPMYGKHLSETAKKRISESLRGRKLSEEHKQHLREASKTRPQISDETRRKLRIARSKRIVQPMYGKNHTDETKRRMSDAWDEERRIEWSKRQTGKQHTDETKNKISRANAGENNGMHGKHISYRKYKEDGGFLSYREFQRVVFKDKDLYNKYVFQDKTSRESILETKETACVAYTGRKHSDETKKKISASHERYVNNEYRQKLSDAKKKYWTDERRRDMSERTRGSNNPFYGRHPSSDTRKKLSESASRIGKIKSEAYKLYKSDGGVLSWNEFQKVIFNDADMYNKYVGI